MLAWLDPGTVTGEFCSSVAGLIQYRSPGEVVRLRTGPRLAEARNQVVDHFAKTDLEWLWFVDSDMVFTPTTLERLLDEAHEKHRPILGGLCRTSEGHPTMFRVKNADLESERITMWEEGTLVEVDTTGTGCLLIHRRVFATMQGKYGKLESGADNPYPWFVEGTHSPNGDPFGEDTAFCLRARGMGIPVYVHTGVKIGHVKTQVIGEVA